MPSYIEAGELLMELNDTDIFDTYNDYSMVFDTIDNFPAADVAPVRHGRWKKSKGNERPTENGFVHDDKYVCDCCGWGCCCETKLDFSFCPNCGARMDGAKND